jgi:CBS domain-containing protein
MRVGDFMNREIVIITAEATVEEACKIMGEKHIGSLVVVADNKPIGIFTERDLLSKVILKGHDIKLVKIKEFMSKPLITIKPEFHLREAARIMAELHIKRLLVMENEKLVGIFTASDLADIISKAPLNF